MSSSHLPNINISEKELQRTYFCVLFGGDGVVKLPLKGDSYLATLGDEVLKLLLL